jgi:hypothetical protein
VIQKDTSITDLLAALPMRERGWVPVQPDPWDADLMAIGVARPDAPRRLVYISTFGLPPGRYYFECETPVGPDPTDHVVEEEGEGDLDRLLSAMIRHLSRGGH